ncbi:MAG TPA: 16S rRNA (cytosine(1402)-N(4))-methyltransferase RsmH [Acidimicrobiales bacterium]
MTRFEHRSVMIDEVVELLRPVPPGLVVDATVGAGGHAAALLAELSQVTLLGLDQDGDAIEAAAATLAPFGSRVTLRQIRFDALTATMEELEVDHITGALFDLGVSSPQFDRAERGFSYRFEGRLDMRMDQRQPRTADDIVNHEDEQSLARILHEHGDERYARRIARAIVAARPLHTTTELADVVRNAIPAPARRRGGHPAKRTFQALRIEVNDELGVLPSALDQVIDALAPRGRCVVISYHSGEDRIVKDRFRQAATGGCTCPPGLPCTCGATPVARELRPLKRRPSAAERAVNPRADSAVMRAVERLPLDTDRAAD